MIDAGTSYRTVAVIGCQSSGKSTLLNLLFDTTFEIMDETQGRQQTTKGIWLNRNAEGNLLVLDIEGTDSKERGEQRMVSSIIHYEISNFCIYRHLSKPPPSLPWRWLMSSLSICGPLILEDMVLQITASSRSFSKST